MKDKTIKIDLSKIANTALQEKVDKELEKVLENILDLNTEAKATRKVTIILTTEDQLPFFLIVIPQYINDFPLKLDVRNLRIFITITTVDG